jgi:hypothetical protein
MLDDVLKAALVKVPERMSWDEVDETQTVQDDNEKKGGSRVTAH